MKTSIIITSSVLLMFSLISFGDINWNPEEQCQSTEKETSNLEIKAIVYETPFAYEVSTRYIETITKKNLHTATTLNELFPKHATHHIDEYSESSVAIIRDNQEEETASGFGGLLNPAQTQLVRKTEYASDIMVKANYKTSNMFSGAIEYRDIVYYISVAPEHQAQYSLGKDALLKLLKDATSIERAGTNTYQVKPGRIKFIVSPSGEVSNAKIESTSGFESMDESLLRLIQNLPAKWHPAKNQEGDAIPQELTLFFGTMGC